jgi:hypothetical protein
MKTIRILTVILFAISLAHAAEEDPTAKFREALKNTMLKLRDAQTQLANAQAAQYAAEAKAQEFEEKSKAIAKELAEERNTSTNIISGLKKDLSERDATIAEQTATLAKWKKSYDEVGKLAVKREIQRRELHAKRLELERKVEEQQFKNIEMYKASMATLERYEKFGLGDAILAREPFTGAQRVKFQGLVQDFADQITDARISTDEPKKKN